MHKEIQENEPITNIFRINCKTATKMMVLGEFSKLSLKHRIAIWYHNLVCKVCYYFLVQSKEINQIIKTQEKNYNVTLTEEKKKEIELSLHKLKEKGV